MHPCKFQSLRAIKPAAALHLQCMTFASLVLGFYVMQVKSWLPFPSPHALLTTIDKSNPVSPEFGDKFTPIK